VEPTTRLEAEEEKTALHVPWRRIHPRTIIRKTVPFEGNAFESTLVHDGRDEG
jgi:hypothetical protein